MGKAEFGAVLRRRLAPGSGRKEGGPRALDRAIARGPNPPDQVHGSSPGAKTRWRRRHPHCGGRRPRGLEAIASVCARDRRQRPASRALIRNRLGVRFLTRIAKAVLPAVEAIHRPFERRHRARPDGSVRGRAGQSRSGERPDPAHSIHVAQRAAEARRWLVLRQQSPASKRAACRLDNRLAGRQAGAY